MDRKCVLVVSAGLYRQLPYDPVKDFTPIASVASGPSILVVGPTFLVRDVASLIAYIKARPRELNYGSAGNGSDPSGRLRTPSTGNDSL